MHLTNARYAGPLYRALNPVYARDPLSGRGAELYGGRFNAKGVAALYTALDPAGALRESNQAGSLQPTILVSYQADTGPIFDTRDTGALSKYGMSDAKLADLGWRAKMLGGQPVPTQNFSEALIEEGYAGLFTRSYAKGATADDFNIVLWRWTGDGCSLAVVDDENRLSRL